MTDPIYETPEEFPAAPILNADEGWVDYPTEDFPGVTTEAFYEEGTEESLPREAKILYGVVHKINDEIPTEPGFIDRQGLNDATRWLYRVACRHARLLSLVNTLAGDVDWIAIPASGTGTTLYLTWTFGADNDPRIMKGIQNVVHGAIVPGLPVFDQWDSRNGYAHVKDFVFTSTTAGTLTLTKPLNADLTGYVSIGYQRAYIQEGFKGYALPRLQLSRFEWTTPMQCAHAVSVPHSILSSYKSVNSEADICAGIDGAFYCAKLAEDGVDLLFFSPTCNNTACPYYTKTLNYNPGRTEITADMITARQINQFLVDRGFFYERDIENPSAPLVYQCDGIDGLLLLHGALRNYGGQITNEIVFENRGLALIERGAEEETEETEYLDFREVQDALVEESATESDAETLLGVLPTVLKAHPIGEFVGDESPTWEKASPLRRCGIMPIASRGGTYPTDMQDGNHHVRMTSALFAVGQQGTTSNGQTKIYGLTSGESLTLLRWTIGPFAEKHDPVARHNKSAVGTVYSATRVRLEGDEYVADPTGDFLRLEFELSQIEFVWIKPGFPPEPQYKKFWSGGNVVAVWDIAHEYWGEEGGGAAGSRQELVYPGDRLDLTLAGDSINLIAVTAAAHAGTEDTSKEAFELLEDGSSLYEGVPNYRIVNQRKRDVVVCDFAQGHGTWTGATLVRAGHNAASPWWTEPVLSRVAIDGEGEAEVEEIDSEDYTYDPATGIFSVTNLAGFTTGYNYRLHAELYVNNRHYVNPYNTVEALNAMWQAFSDAAWYEHSPNVTTFKVFYGYRNTDAPFTVRTGLVIAAKDSYYDPEWGITHSEDLSYSKLSWTEFESTTQHLFPPGSIYPYDSEKWEEGWFFPTPDSIPELQDSIGFPEDSKILGNQFPALTYQHCLWGCNFTVRAFTPRYACTSAEIKAAKVSYTIPRWDMLHYHKGATWDRLEEGADEYPYGWEDFGEGWTTGTDNDIEFVVCVWRISVHDRGVLLDIPYGKITWRSSNIADNVLKKVETGTESLPTWTVEADVTENLKAVLDMAAAGEEEYLAVVVMPKGFITSETENPDIWALLRATGQWNRQNNASTGVNESGSGEGYYLKYWPGTVNHIMIQYSWGDLEQVDLHLDAAGTARLPRLE